MKGILWVEFFRTIGHSFGRFLAILAIIALGAGFFSGLKTAKPAMVATADTYLSEQNMFDLTAISTIGFPDDAIDDLESVTGVTAVQPVISHDILGKVAGEHNDSTFQVRSLPKTISALRVVEGRLPRTATECVADSAVMGTDVIGEKVTWSDTNNERSLAAFTTQGCTITGVASSPNFLNIERGASDIGNGKTYAFLAVPRSAFDDKTATSLEIDLETLGQAYSSEYDESVTAVRPTVKDEVRRLAEKRRTNLIAQARTGMLAAAPAQAAPSIEAMSDDDIVSQASIPSVSTYVLTRSSNLGYASFSNDTGVIEGIALIFPIFFLFVAAMVCLTTVTKMIDEERSQIGLLKALGYRNGAIGAKYLGYSGLASLLGCVLGILLGTFLFPLAIWAGYGIIYDFAPLTFVFDWLPALLNTGGYLLVMAAVTLTVCWRELRAAPALLLRPEAPAPGKKILLERIRPLWNRVSFLHKVSLRNVFRFKKRLFMILAGVAGCTALIVACFGMRDSVSAIPDYQFDRVDLYSASVQLQEPQPRDGETLAEATEQSQQDFLDTYHADIAASGFVYENSVDADVADTTKQMTIMAPRPGDNLKDVVDLHDGGTELSLPKSGEILVGRGLAHSTGLTTGDTVTLRSLDGETVDLTVSGIFDNYIGTPAYITLTDAKTLWSDASAHTALVKFKDGVNETEVFDEMETDSSIQFTTPVSDDRDQLYTFMRALDAIVALIILSAGALALIVLLNLTGINITERLREIATIKVLGFYQRETAAYVFRENILLTSMGILVGLPIGKLFHMFMMSQIKVDVMYMVPDIYWASYLYSALLTFGFLGVTLAVMYKRISGIDMAGALKSPE